MSTIGPAGAGAAGAGAGGDVGLGAGGVPAASAAVVGAEVVGALEARELTAMSRLVALCELLKLITLTAAAPPVKAHRVAAAATAAVFRGSMGRACRPHP